MEASGIQVREPGVFKPLWVEQFPLFEEEDGTFGGRWIF